MTAGQLLAILIVFIPIVSLPLYYEWKSDIRDRYKPDEIVKMNFLLFVQLYTHYPECFLKLNGFVVYKMKCSEDNLLAVELSCLSWIVFNVLTYTCGLRKKSKANKIKISKIKNDLLKEAPLKKKRNK